MRIVYVTASFPWGTAEPFLVPELTELRRQGHAVLVVPLRPHGAMDRRAVAPLLPDTRALSLWSPRLAGAALRGTARGRPLAIALDLVRRSRNPRILARNLAAVPKALWLAEVAREFKAHHIHAHRASVASTLAMVAGEIAGIPWSFTAHRWDIFEDNLLREKVRRARFARFIARSGADEARPIVGPLLDERAVVVHMGVPLPAVAGVRRVGAPGRVLLCPASLTRRKGQRHLVAALASLPPDTGLTLWLAGAGPEEAALREQVEASGIAERVRFLGQVRQAQLLEWYQAGEIFAVVLPSLHEGIPVALMEAMSLGVPVIATRTGGTPELVDGETGLLVPPGDSAALAGALAALLADPALGPRLAAAARVKVAREFAIERVVGDLVALFERATPVGARAPAA